MEESASEDRSSVLKKLGYEFNEQLELRCISTGMRSFFFLHYLTNISSSLDIFCADMPFTKIYSPFILSVVMRLILSAVSHFLPEYCRERLRIRQSGKTKYLVRHSTPLQPRLWPTAPTQHPFSLNRSYQWVL